jgi:curved DNA-binding protein CbpA
MSKRTLYELLGEPTTATAGELRDAYRREMTALEARRAELTPEAFREQQQLLRAANDTLSNPVMRANYDAKLEATLHVDRAAYSRTALVARDGARADALGLRADALSLRADAMLARAELGAFDSREPSVTTGLLSVTKIVVRSIGLLVVIGAFAFGATRWMVGTSPEQLAAMEARAAEQVALQDYFQTHGVRPANMAELERMETERRRSENEARQTEQERRKQEADHRRWEEDSRRIGEQAARNVWAADEALRRRAERDRELKFREEQLQLELKEARSETERRRLELQIRQLRERRQLP